MTDAPKYRVKVETIDEPVFGDDDASAIIWARKTLTPKKSQLSVDAKVYLFRPNGRLVDGFPMLVSEFLP